MRLRMHLMKEYFAIYTCSLLFICQHIARGDRSGTPGMELDEEGRYISISSLSGSEPDTADFPNLDFRWWPITSSARYSTDVVQWKGPTLMIAGIWLRDKVDSLEISFGLDPNAPSHAFAKVSKLRGSFLVEYKNMAPIIHNPDRDSSRQWHRGWMEYERGTTKSLQTERIHRIGLFMPDPSISLESVEPLLGRALNEVNRSHFNLGFFGGNNLVCVTIDLTAFFYDEEDPFSDSGWGIGDRISREYSDSEERPRRRMRLESQTEDDPEAAMETSDFDDQSGDNPDDNDDDTTDVDDEMDELEVDSFSSARTSARNHFR